MNMPEKEKETKWESTLKQLEKDFGKGSLIGAREKPAHIESISTGSVALNKALGIGGLPKGRIVEIIGAESSGKTTMIMHLIAEGQKISSTRKFAIIDAEHALDLEYAEALGVDLDRLLISQPDYGEQALEIAKRLIDTGEMSIIAIDSVAALVPKSEIEGEVGDASVGKQARMMSQALRMLAGKAEKNGTILMFTNQIREKIGVMWGNPEVGSGGNALKFYASVRLDIRKVTINKDGEEAISNRVRVKVTKNKVSPPFRQAEFNIVYGKGIDKFNEIIELGVECGIINKSGSWYSYKEDKIGQGLDSVISLLSDNPDLYEQIKAETIEKISC